MRVLRSGTFLGVAAIALALSQVSASAHEERTTSNLNLRTGPGMHYPVHAVIPAGAVVDVVSCGHDWCHLKWAGQVGYSNASWIVATVHQTVPIKHVK
jgi:uncharacterized protein YraI